MDKKLFIYILNLPVPESIVLVLKLMQIKKHFKTRNSKYKF